MNDWLTQLHLRLSRSNPVVRVVMASVRGSAPREAGAVMLVDANSACGTIGGGHLEWKATDIARSLLSQPDAPTARIDRFALGATLGQCCGGAVELWFDRYGGGDVSFVADALEQSRHGNAVLLTALGASLKRHIVAQGNPLPAGITLPPNHAATLSRLPDGTTVLGERIAAIRHSLWLFGAGHVGKALVKALADLPFQITWIDSREEIFPLEVPSHVTVLATDDPAEAAPKAPRDALFLVLTHSHDLDYDICRAILSRESFAWAGLIGSRSKAARFRQRLLRQGYAANRVARLVCPIGVPGVSSKLPAAIAIAVAAQLLAVIEDECALGQAAAPAVNRMGSV